MRCNVDGTGEINQPCLAGCNAADKLCQAEYKDANILWRHEGGQVAVWIMNHTADGGGHVRGPELGVQDVAWTIRGTGDFDGDGHSDILFSSSGRTQIWFMKDGVKLHEAAGADPGLGWAVAGVGDFDGDDRADILWRKGDQLAMSFQGTRWDEVSAPIDPGWDVQFTGDFDGDAHSDILWRHSSGGIAIWFMNRTRAIRAIAPGGQGPGSTWRIQGVGDFDADSRDDILWRNTTPPFSFAVWFAGVQPMAGAVSTAEAWEVEFIGDFNHDKHADIQWRGPDGKLAIWFVSGTSFIRDLVSGQDDSLPAADPGWKINGLLRD